MSFGFMILTKFRILENLSELPQARDVRVGTTG